MGVRGGATCLAAIVHELDVTTARDARHGEARDGAQRRFEVERCGEEVAHFRKKWLDCASRGAWVSGVRGDVCSVRLDSIHA
jgi:hypothetical protein